MVSAVRSGQTVAGDGETKGLAVPVKTRGQVVGVIDAHLPDGAGEWTPQQRALLEALADQLGIALESAQLYFDAQLRAAREQRVGQITEGMQRAAGMQDLIQTTMQELQAALDTSYAVVHLGTEDDLRIRLDGMASGHEPGENASGSNSGGAQ
jgi:GAF domain-containing protein